MELEVLKGKFNDALGSTRLQLSERTLDGVLQDALAEIGDDDTRVTDDFIQRKISLAKTIDGQINHDVSTRIEDWKKKNVTPPAPPTPPTPPADDEPAWFKAYREQQDKKMQEIEEARKHDLIKATKADVLKKVREGIKSDYSKQNMEVNDYLLNNALKEIEIPDENADVKSLIKSAKLVYDEAVKAVGFEPSAPRNNAPTGDSKVLDSLWAKKQSREGWGKNKK